MRSAYKPRFKLDVETKERILEDVLEYERSWKKRNKRRRNFKRFFHLSFQTAVVAGLVLLLIKSPIQDSFTNQEESPTNSVPKEKAPTVESPTISIPVNDGLELVTIAPRMVTKNEVQINEIEGNNNYKVIAVGGSLVNDPSQGVLKITAINDGKSSHTEYFKTNVKHGPLSVEVKNSGIRIVTEDGMEWEVKFSGSINTFNQKFIRGEIIYD
jgi:hypothetical protein